jgi:hypothetical protein
MRKQADDQATQPASHIAAYSELVEYSKRKQQKLGQFAAAYLKMTFETTLSQLYRHAQNLGLIFQIYFHFCNASSLYEGT